MNSTNIAVIGTGYVGLVVGACFAEHGRLVTCVDQDEEKVRQLKQGKSLFYEPGLSDIIRRNVRSERLRFTSDAVAAIKDNDIIMLAVGTPATEDGSADLSQIMAVAKDISLHLDHDALVVVKSTVPVGTTVKVKEVIESANNSRINIAFNPEFLSEGNAVSDFMHPDRTVVGCESDEVGRILEDVYSPFISPQSPIFQTDIASAEMIKYSANAMLATKVSFMNEMAMLCERLGANIEKVKRGIGLDHRIGDKFLNAGLGFGGSCFPKDLDYLMYAGKQHGSLTAVIDSVVDVNRRVRKFYIDKITEHYKGDLSGRRFAIWGLSFKPNTDDMRDAPSIDVVAALSEAGAECHVYDPEAMERAKTLLGDGVTYHNNAYSVCEDADALLVLTEWTEFRSPDWQRIRDRLTTQIVFDGRNLYDPVSMKKAGYTYYSMGRPTEKPED